MISHGFATVRARLHPARVDQESHHPVPHARTPPCVRPKWPRRRHASCVRRWCVGGTPHSLLLLLLATACAWIALPARTKLALLAPVSAHNLVSKDAAANLQRSIAQGQPAFFDGHIIVILSHPPSGGREILRIGREARFIGKTHVKKTKLSDARSTFLSLISRVLQTVHPKSLFPHLYNYRSTCHGPGANPQAWKSTGRS